MITRIFGFIVATLILICVHLAEAQEPGKMPRIGYLSGGGASASGSLIDGFRQGLKDHGTHEAHL
jgi:hypothetical protein